MQKSKIEWTNYVWNPIRGLCPEACWYCYARRMYRRFKLDPKPWLDVAELNMTLKTKRTGKRVFVCSTFELFHPILDTVYGRVLFGSNWSWRDYIFDVIQRRPDLTFIILTKRPERIDRPMPDNVWLGVSVTQRKDVGRLLGLRDAKAKVKFISFEPVLGIVPYVWPLTPDWVIVGRLTGHGKKNDPEKWQINGIVGAARRTGTAIFLKNNLKDIWSGPLIQEYPR